MSILDLWIAIVLTWMLEAFPGSSTKSSNCPCMVAKLNAYGLLENLQQRSTMDRRERVLPLKASFSWPLKELTYVCPTSSDSTSDFWVISSTKLQASIPCEKTGSIPICKENGALATGCSTKKTKVNSRGSPVHCCSFSSSDHTSLLLCIPLADRVEPCIFSIVPMIFDLSNSVDGVTVAVAGVETPRVAPKS